MVDIHKAAAERRTADVKNDREFHFVRYLIFLSSHVVLFRIVDLKLPITIYSTEMESLIHLGDCNYQIILTWL